MNLGDRQKGYEKVWDSALPRRMPVCVRIDGRKFSSWTRRAGVEKPFDPKFLEAMWETTKALCEDTPGVVVGYHQSDEISLLLKNDQTFLTEPYRANRVQKIVTDLASIATAAFNQFLKPEKFARFDARVWVVPEAEVNNYFLWRQQDAYKNCVSAVAHYGLIDKYGRSNALSLLHGKHQEDREKLILKELGIDMEDYPRHLKYGACAVRELYIVPVKDSDVGATRSRWVIDKKIPEFDYDPNYIGSRYFTEEPMGYL